MRFGIGTAMRHESPRQWAQQLVTEHCSAAAFPVNYLAGEDVINAYAEAAAEAGIRIAEVGAWTNLFDSEEAVQYAIGQLRLADRLGACCAVSLSGAVWTPQRYERKEWLVHPAINFSEETLMRLTGILQRIIDTAEPEHTFFTVEPTPCMMPSSAEEMLELMERVDRPQLGLHMDIANILCTPERWADPKGFIDHTMELVGPYIRSAHLKDLRRVEGASFDLEECAVGEGTLPYEHYIRRLHAIDPGMPVLIEHLADDAAYRRSFAFMREHLERYYHAV